MPQIIDLGRVRFAFKGNYSASTTYELNDVIKYGGSSYVYVNNVPASNNDPNTTTHWAQMTDGIQYENNYSASSSYQKNDVVVYGEQTYIALQDTIGNNPENATYWKIFTGGLGFKGEWNSASTYYPADIVRRGGRTFYSNITHTAASAFSIDFDENKWQIFADGIRNRGVWETETEYLINDLVSDELSTYIALEDHVSGNGLFANEPSGLWQEIAEGADFLPSQLGQENAFLSTDGTDPFWTKDVVLNDAEFKTNEHFIGALSKDITLGSHAFTDYGLVVSASAGGNSESFAQIAFTNVHPDGYGSTDILAYTQDGSNDSGWIDMGITGANFDSEVYGITGPHDGYIFMVAPEGTTGEGNLVFATGDTGTANKVIFAAGGLTSGTTQMEITPGQNVHVEIATESTSPSTGAFTVAGGAGIQGNLNVLGNVETVGNVVIQGSISVAGGQFVTENLSSTDPLLFVGNQNEGNDFDLGFMTEAKQPSASASVIFGTKQVSASVATLTTAEYSISLRQVSASVATLTTSLNSFKVGDKIRVAGVNATFNGDHIVTARTNTSVSYVLPAEDVGPDPSSGTVQRIINTAAREVVASDFLTISGAGAEFNGPRHLSAVTETSVQFTLNIENLSPTAISPAAVGTRNTRSKFSGIVKDNFDGRWHLVSNIEVKPTTTVDFTNPELYYDELEVGEVIAPRGFNNFANNAERDAEIPTPVHGTIIFNRAINAQQFYTGSKWETVDPITPLLLMGV